MHVIFVNKLTLTVITSNINGISTDEGRSTK